MAIQRPTAEQLQELASRLHISLTPAQAEEYLAVMQANFDAYDLIAQTRLDHQARLIRAGKRPDNFMAPSDLSDFERSHLRDAFVVIRTMQSALGQRSGVLG